MTGAHCATFSLITPPKIQLKPLPISSVTAKFPSKPTKRKNHLRPKILKTLTKPSTPQLPPTNPIIPIISPPQHDTVSDSPSFQIPPEIIPTVDTVEEFHVSETTPGTAVEYSGSFGNFSAKSVLKYGWYFVGVFVFHTIATVWVRGNANPDKKDDNLNNSDLGVNGIHKGKVLLTGKNGSKVSNVEPELELKIQEIRAMAKEARETEKNEVKDDGLSGIEKEVAARLLKLEKRLDSKGEKKVSVMDFLDMYGIVEDEASNRSFDAKGADKNLVFKKKFKYRSPSMNVTSKPEGFQGLVDNNVAKNEYNDLETVERSGSVGDDGFDEVDKGEETGILNGDSRESVFRTVEMDSGREVPSRKLNFLQNDEKERGRANTGIVDTDMRSGAVQGTQGRSSVEVMKLKNSRDLETQNSQNFTKENQKITTKSDMYGTVGDVVSKGSFDAKGTDTNLVFKKKVKFRSSSMSARSKPKGFRGLVDNNVAKNEYNDLETVKRSGRVGDNGFDEVDKGEQTGILNGDSRESVFGTVEMDSGREIPNRKLNSLQSDEKERGRAKAGVADTNMRSGAVQGTQGRSSVEVMKLKNSRDLETQNSQNFTKENQKTTTKSDKHALVGRNGSSKHGEVGNEPLANRVRDRPADVKTDLWWLNLPYVLAIQGFDSDGTGGLFTLRITSQAHDESDSFCTVAFEDRGDANNFCYLLESSFEDEGDFRAKIAPLSIKELYKVVDSDTKKVIVVKKGQLKLYAGQPWADVEIALHSLVQQNNK